MPGINIGTFGFMRAASGIGNQKKLISLGDDASELLNGKRVCDLGAGVTGFLNYILEEGYSPSSCVEVDPIFLDEDTFTVAKESAIANVSSLVSKLGVQREVFLDAKVKAEEYNSQHGGNDIEALELSQSADRELSVVDKYLEDSRKQIAHIQGNNFSPNNRIVRYPDINKVGKGDVDILFMTSLFYASENPAVLLWGLSKLLSDEGKVVIIDHSHKQHIPRLLRLSHTISGLDVLFTEEPSDQSKDKISVFSFGKKPLKELHRRLKV